MICHYSTSPAPYCHLSLLQTFLLSSPLTAVVFQLSPVTFIHCPFIFLSPYHNLLTNITPILRIFLKITISPVAVTLAPHCHLLSHWLSITPSSYYLSPVHVALPYHSYYPEHPPLHCYHPVKVVVNECLTHSSSWPLLTPLCSSGVPSACGTQLCVS